jgi:hypothetical protein
MVKVRGAAVLRVWAVQVERWLWLGSDTFLVSEGLLDCYAVRGVGGVLYCLFCLFILILYVLVQRFPNFFK